MRNRTITVFGAAVCAAAGVAHAGVPFNTELLSDPGFDEFGAFWGTFGAAGINDFFGGNPHASLFADGNGNFGGVFQVGIGNTEGVTYQFSLTDVRIESNFNANFRFGLEFYAADDATKLGEVLVNIDTNDPSDGLVTGDGLSFSMQATNTFGAAIVRPIALFDNAAPLGSGQANAFVFNASLVIVPAPAAAGLFLTAAAIGTRRRR
jgi:hypothetical protein